MIDRLRGCRLPCAAAVLAFAAGVAARSELQRRLNGGRLLRPDEPHRYDRDPRWPSSCRCGKPKDAPVHQVQGAVR
jgi:hypothetical protein